MKTCLGLAIVLCLSLIGSTCERKNPAIEQRPMQKPKLKISPLADDRGLWKIATSDTVTFAVTAPGAEKVEIFSRPEGWQEGEENGLVELKELTAPNPTPAGEYSTQWTASPDFAGEIWAEALYPDGVRKATDSILLTTETAAMMHSGIRPSNSTLGSVGTDESARSDKLTGGQIERQALKPGASNIRITVNVPAFQLTLWQNGKEVQSYPIGIGRKNFPLPVGEREASAIIFNPRWIPPDSAWVRRSTNVEPYERIEPGDPRNPLGKIKIPLGEGYLIHEAASPSDIGHPVSHGCVRLLRADLFDLAEKIIRALALPVSPQQIVQARGNDERLLVQFNAPLLVDINYDTQVVEGGMLHLYPDVYDRDTFSTESLRSELQSSGVNASQLEEPVLKGMMSRVSQDKQFVIKVAAIKAGRFDAGQRLPIVPPSPQLARSLAAHATHKISPPREE